MITQTQNMDLVNSILRHKDIWSDISDGMPAFDTPYVPGVIYFLVNETDGVILFHPFRDGLKLHPNFPKKYRGKVAYDAIESAIQSVIKDYQTIYCEIDVELKHIIRCARHLGFNHLESGDRLLLVRRHLDT